MRETNIFSYYAFGYNYFLLRTGRKGEAVKNAEWSLKKIIEMFFKKIDELDLKVTKGAASDLKSILEDIEDLPEDAIVDAALSEKVKNACDKLDTTLDSELQLRSAFIVTPKRFEIHNLLNEPWNLLNKQTIKELPKLCVSDFASSCRCIAFNLSTAAVFHLMRCLEGALRKYYCKIVKRKRIKVLLWGPMVDHLRSRRSPPSKALLDHLDNIRFNFRNPTQHPDAKYDSDEAQDLLAVAIDALNRIAKDLV